MMVINKESLYYLGEINQNAIQEFALGLSD